MILEFAKGKKSKISINDSNDKVVSVLIRLLKIFKKTFCVIYNFSVSDFYF